MLTIKTYLGISPVNGIGIFADESIPKGKIVWEYFPLIDISYTQKEWKELEQNLAGPSFEMLKRYAYKEHNKYIICMDNAQFMNHSATGFNISNTDDLKSMFSIRDIAKGEELLCNYEEYSDNDDHHIEILRDN